MSQYHCSWETWRSIYSLHTKGRDGTHQPLTQWTDASIRMTQGRLHHWWVPASCQPSTSYRQVTRPCAAGEHEGMVVCILCGLVFLTPLILLRGFKRCTSVSVDAASIWIYLSSSFVATTDGSAHVRSSQCALLWKIELALLLGETSSYLWDVAFGGR